MLCCEKTGAIMPESTSHSQRAGEKGPVAASIMGAPRRPPMRTGYMPPRDSDEWGLPEGDYDEDCE